jgi:integrase/recombinase XerC
MREHLSAFRQHLEHRHRSKRTRDTYEAILASYFAFLVLESKGTRSPGARADVEAFLARPRRDGRARSAAGRNQELAALRAFMRFAERDLTLATDPTEGVPFVREPRRDPPVLSVPELRRLFTVAAARVDVPSVRARDLAVVALLSQSGLRVHELVGLDLAQFDLASATLVAVRGKGGTVHDLPLNAGTIALVSAWLTAREGMAVDGDPALFVSSRGRRISIRSVERLLVGFRVGMGTAKRVTPHTLRHSCATAALTLGTDLSTVAELLRHADLNTTRGYLHLVDERRRDAVRRLGSTIPRELLLSSKPENSQEIPQGTIVPYETKEGSSGGLDDQYGLGDVGEAA